MEITVTEIAPSKKNVKIAITKEEIQQKYESKLEELRTSSPIKGFRPGKVPLDVAEKKFGKIILKEMKMMLVYEGYQQAIKDHQLQPLRDPDIKDEAVVVEKDQPCTIEFAVDTLPEFTLPQYQEREVKQPTIRVTTKEIDVAMNKLLKMHGEWVYAEDSVSEEGDQIICDVNLKVGDKLIWGKQNFSMEVEDVDILGIMIGQKLFVGKKAGEEAAKSVVVPADFKIAEYRGEKGEIVFSILEIKKPKLPEATDEFARGLGAQDMPDLKRKLRDQLREEREAGLNGVVERDIIAGLVRDTQIQVPEGFVKSRTAQMAQATQNKMQKEGKSESAIQAHMEKNKEKIEQEVIQQLKEYLIIEKIAQQEKIDATDEEIDNYLGQIAAAEGKWPNEIREEYERKGMAEELKFQVKSQKVLTFLREHAKMVE